jgi:hypothetical protein
VTEELDWEEFERRGRERRRNRPPKPDLFTNVLTGILFTLVVVFAVWGVMK